MNVLLVSQCSKNALKETRRIIDQFAERCGDRTWQTPITKQGLDTLRRVLKKTARKNTAVACHWIHGKDHSEMIWVVGNAARFNHQGAVPTNTTRSDVLRIKDEDDWHSIDTVRSLAAIAALFHDFGKSNKAFQSKLNSKKPMADALRHEWVSLRLLQAFVGKDRDEEWLTRLAELSEDPDVSWLKRIVEDVDVTSVSSPFKNLPPIASMVGWLIVSHHRMPNKGRRTESIEVGLLDRLPKGINPLWGGSRLFTEEETDKDKKQLTTSIQACWTFPGSIPFNSRSWRTRIRKHAKKLLNSSCLLDNAPQDSWDPYIMHLSRLVLMLADHYYSSLTEAKERVAGDLGYRLIANTDRRTGETNQRLDEHLIGVEREIGRILCELPKLEHRLPRIARHKFFKKRSADPRFRWQNKAFDLATSLRESSKRHGFFGVNMASTGTGKTLANARIAYGLADSLIGARFTVALGLRTLTLQTGEAYRQRLGLGADDLAILVGGASVRALFEHFSERDHNENDIEGSGSESARSLLDEGSFVHYEGSLADGPLRDWMINTRGANALINAPVVTCTIDHLVPSTDSLRGGRQIAPMLRLMTSDLVLDEPDDFGIEDMPALCRLVNWVGMLGSRVVLSSATLPPALVQALFESYLKGREAYQRNRGNPGTNLSVETAWFDEFDCQAGEHSTTESFLEQHDEWLIKRCGRISEKDERRRRAKIIPVDFPVGLGESELATELAKIVLPRVHELHCWHHSIDSATGKSLSLGLVRMANIDPLISLFQAVSRIGGQEDYHLHLVCYHSQFPLLLRSRIERRLDALLKRHDSNAVFSDPEVRSRLDKSQKKNHIFIVMATAVAEVGRDHDYDWSIVEPSSMRSIIQLSGRVRRHRTGEAQNDNVLILDRNVNALKGKRPAYCRPGFEDDLLSLDCHRITELLTDEQLERIDSRSRIKERDLPTPTQNLVDLEHSQIRKALLGDDNKSKLPAHYWWSTRAHLSGELQRKQPFRRDDQGSADYCLHYDQEEEEISLMRIERDGTSTNCDHLMHPVELLAEDTVEGMSYLLDEDYLVELERLAGEMDMEVEECSRRFGRVSLPERGSEQGWDFNPVLGFRRRK